MPFIMENDENNRDVQEDDRNMVDKPISNNDRLDEYVKSFQNHQLSYI